MERMKLEACQPAARFPRVYSHLPTTVQLGAIRWIQPGVRARTGGNNQGNKLTNQGN